MKQKRARASGAVMGAKRAKRYYENQNQPHVGEANTKAKSSPTIKTTDATPSRCWIAPKDMVERRFATPGVKIVSYKRCSIRQVYKKDKNNVTRVVAEWQEFLDTECKNPFVYKKDDTTAASKAISSTHKPRIGSFHFQFP